MKRLTLTEFLKNFYNRYPTGLDLDLSNFEYITAKTKSITRCKIHNISIMNTPDALMSGIKRCHKCKSESIKKAQRYTLEICLEKFRQAHGDKYDYSLVDYNTISHKVKIICPTHGIFEQNPQLHWEGRGCTKPGCAYSTLRKDVSLFINEASNIHNNRYDYTNIKYINNYTEIEVNCITHGIFKITPVSHTIYQRGCPLCFPGNRSYVETAWLNSLNVPLYCRQKRIICGHRRYLVDAIIDNVVYEFWGDFWHGNPKIYSSLDKNGKNGKTFGELYQKTLEKRTCILEAGYQLIEIWEADFRKSLRN